MIAPATAHGASTTAEKAVVAIHIHLVRRGWRAWPEQEMKRPIENPAAVAKRIARPALRETRQCSGNFKSRAQKNGRTQRDHERIGPNVGLVAFGGRSMFERPEFAPGQRCQQCEHQEHAGAETAGDHGPRASRPVMIRRGGGYGRVGHVRTLLVCAGCPRPQ